MWSQDLAHGQVHLLADGTFFYQPNAHWFGIDILTYNVSNGPDTSGNATITITVTRGQ